MKKIICFLSALIATQMAAQNVGINPGGSTPDASSILDLNTGNTYTNPNGKGLLIPNVALTATNASNPVTSPATSLLVYNTATAGAGSTAVSPGYYYWNGTRWIALGGPGSNNWALLGNGGITNPAAPGAYGTSTFGATENWLGTTDANDITFGTNNIERMRIKQTNGFVGIGLAAPTSRFHVSRGDIGVGRIDGGDDTPYARFGLSNGWEQYLANNAFYNAGTGQWNFVNTGGYGGTASMLYQISGTMQFYTASNGANPVAWSQRMTILNNGNIGINNSAPAQRLDVGGAIQFSGALMPSGSAGTADQTLLSQGPGLPPVWGWATAGQQFATVYSTAQIALNNGSAITPIPGLSQTITIPANGTYDMYIFTDGGCALNTGGANQGEQLEISIWVDGVAVRYITSIVQNPSNYISGINNWATSGFINGLAPGPHTVVVQARNRGSAGIQILVAATNAVGNYLRASLSVGLVKK